MSEHWKNKSDRTHAHKLQEKAYLAELEAEKTRIIEKVTAIQSHRDIWHLAQEMRQFCKDNGYWYTSSFSDMEVKIMRLYNSGFLDDDDLAGFTEATRLHLLRFRHVESLEELRSGGLKE